MVEANRKKIVKNLDFFSPLSLVRIKANLEKKEPPSSDLVFLNSKNGLPIFKYQGKLMHSKFDPHQESQRRWKTRYYHLQKNIFYLNSDFLYEIEVGMNQLKKNQNKLKKKIRCQLFLFYSHYEIFYKMLATRNLDFLQDFKKVEVYFPQNINFFIIDLEKIEDINFFTVYPPEIYSKNAFLNQVAEIIDTHQKRKLSQKITNLNFQFRWIKNIAHNVSTLTNVHPFAELVKKYPNQKAMLLGAGLSLYHHFTEIKQRQKQGEVMIAVDTILPALLKRKIIPDLIIALDGGYYNSLDFKNMLENRSGLKKNTCLITTLVLYPASLNHFPGKKYFFAFEKNDDFIKGLINEIFKFSNHFSEKKNFILAGSGVASIMLEIALKLSFHHVSLWGLDFKGIFFQNHLFESMHLDVYYQNSSRLNPMVNQEFLEIHHSLDQESKKKIKMNSTNSNTYSVTLKKYQKECFHLMAKRKEIYWENKSHNDIIIKNQPTASVSVNLSSPKLKPSSPPQGLKEKKLFNPQERKELINHLKSNLDQLLQEIPIILKTNLSHSHLAKILVNPLSRIEWGNDPHNLHYPNRQNNNHNEIREKILNLYRKINLFNYYLRKFF